MQRLAAAILVLGLGGRAGADEPAANAEAGRAAEAVGLARAEAERYRIVVEGRADAAIALEKEALLQWSNPVAGSIHGSVFVWTDRGTPVAVGSIYKWFSPKTHTGVELHAISPRRLSADREGRRLWSPSRPGVEFRAIPGAQAPAESPAGRLRQMRAMAKEFAGGETTREGVARELRLLTQPIYRYESTDPDVVDGGLFAFVEGTDPEIVLAMEARRTAKGVEWQFAAARMNSVALRLKQRDREVWSVPEIPWSQARDHAEPYSLFIFHPDPGMGAGDDA
jgi:hypothetical protein